LLILDGMTQFDKLNLCWGST